MRRLLGARAIQPDWRGFLASGVTTRAGCMGGRGGVSSLLLRALPRLTVGVSSSGLLMGAPDAGLVGGELKRDLDGAGGAEDLVDAGDDGRFAGGGKGGRGGGQGRKEEGCGKGSACKNCGGMTAAAYQKETDAHRRNDKR